MVHVLRPLPSARLRLLVFDLDGTLIDSKQDLAEAVNATLRQFGLPPQTHERIASYIGDGAAVLIERALAADAADPALAPAALAAFLDYYHRHLLDHTRPYPGVPEQLHRLREALPQARMAVLTNKPVRASISICEGLGLAPFFTTVYGGNSFPTKKPDPQGLLQLISEAGVQADETVMVGDSEVDILTARAAGAWSLGCRYGLSAHSIADMEAKQLVDVVVDAPSEWAEALGVQAAQEASLGL